MVVTMKSNRLSSTHVNFLKTNTKKRKQILLRLTFVLSFAISLAHSFHSLCSFLVLLSSNNIEDINPAVHQNVSARLAC